MENKTQNIKGKQLFNQIAIHNREEKSCACSACTKTGHECSSYKFFCAFATYRARVTRPKVVT